MNLSVTEEQELISPVSNQLKLVLSCIFIDITQLSCDVFTAVSECLIELEPMVRKYDEIDFLEAVLQIKRLKVSQESAHFCFFLSVHVFWDLNVQIVIEMRN